MISSKNKNNVILGNIPQSPFNSTTLVEQPTIRLYFHSVRLPMAGVSKRHPIFLIHGVLLKDYAIREKGGLGCSAHRQVALLTAGTQQRTSSGDNRQ